VHKPAEVHDDPGNVPGVVDVFAPVIWRFDEAHPPLVSAVGVVLVQALSVSGYFLLVSSHNAGQCDPYSETTVEMRMMTMTDDPVVEGSAPPWCPLQNVQQLFKQAEQQFKCTAVPGTRHYFLICVCIR
jgi:hypothetical protein